MQMLPRTFKRKHINGSKSKSMTCENMTMNQRIYIYTCIYIRHIECRKESTDDNDDKNQKSSSLSWMGPRARLCPFSLCVWCMCLCILCKAERNVYACCCCLLCSLVGWLYVRIASYCFYFYFCSNLQLKRWFRLYHFRPSNECDFTSISKDAHIHSLTHSLDPLPYLEMNLFFSFFFFFFPLWNVYMLQLYHPFLV